MANERIEGKVVGVKIEDQFLRCQADATLNITINTEQDEECKDLDYVGDNVAGASGNLIWEDSSISTAAWSIDLNAGMFYDSVAGEVDFVDEVVNKDNVVFSVQFVIPSKGEGTSAKYFEGDAVLTSLSLNAPTTGKATQDLSFTGKGKPTWTKVPYVAPGGE